MENYNSYCFEKYKYIYIYILNAMNTNKRRIKVPVELRRFFKHEKEERRSFFYELIQSDE